MKKEKLNGREVMFFVNELPFALATSCTLEVTTVTQDARTKDSPDGSDKEFDYCDWIMSSENLIGASADASDPTNNGVQYLYDDMIKLQLTGELVDVAIARVQRAGGGIPEEGWTFSELGAENFGVYHGRARVVSTSASFPDNGKATCSVKLEGVGILSRTPRATQI